MLTEKQKIYCEKRSRGIGAKEAYILAGYNDKSKPERLDAQPEIQAEITRLILAEEEKKPRGLKGLFARLGRK